MTPTTITVPASELTSGDWVVGEGFVLFAMPAPKGKIVAFIGSSSRVLTREELLCVHLEDYGEEE